MEKVSSPRRFRASCVRKETDFGSACGENKGIPAVYSPQFRAGRCSSVLIHRGGAASTRHFSYMPANAGPKCRRIRADLHKGRAGVFRAKLLA